MAKVGTEGYGIWALTGVIASYQVFVDFGLTTAIIRFVAKEAANKDFGAISEYVVVALGIYIVFPSILVFLIILLRYPLVVNILGIKQNIETATFLITLAAISSLLNMIAGIFKSIIDGMQRMDISNILLTIQVILSAIGTVFFLQYGFGLKGLAINLLVMSILSLIANMYFSKIALPEYKIKISFFKISRFKEIFSYSVHLQLSSLSRVWIEPLNKVIIAHIFSLSYVGFYDVALKVINTINMLIASALSPIFPASTEINEVYGFAKVEELRIKSTKYILPITIFIYSLMISIMPSFVNLWLGPKYAIVSPTIQIFLVSSFFVSLAIPAYTILTGLGYAYDAMKMQFQSAIVNVLGIIILSFVFGFYGFCSGFALSIIYGFAAIHFYYKKRFDKNLNVYKIFFEKRIVFFMIFFALISNLSFIYVKLNSYFTIFCWGIGYLLLSVFITVKLKIFTNSDVEQLLGKKLFSILRLNLFFPK